MKSHGPYSHTFALAGRRLIWVLVIGAFVCAATGTARAQQALQAQQAQQAQVGSAKPGSDSPYIPIPNAQAWCSDEYTRFVAGVFAARVHWRAVETLAPLIAEHQGDYTRIHAKLIAEAVAEQSRHRRMHYDEKFLSVSPRPGTEMLLDPGRRHGATPAPSAFVPQASESSDQPKASEQASAQPPVPADEPPVPADEPPVPADALPADASAQLELLVVSLSLHQHLLADAMVAFLLAPPAHLRDNNWRSQGAKRLFVPLEEVADALGFPISVDPVSGDASGWFLSPERTFDLDLSANEVVIGNRRHRFAPDRVFHKDNTVFVELAELERWWPLIFTFDFSQMAVMVVSHEKLPIQQRHEREQRRKRQARQQPKPRATYEDATAPYRLISWPVHDLRAETALPTAKMLASGAASGRAITQSNRYQLAGAGDLFFMSGRWFISGSEQQPLSDARLILERKDPRGQLLGAAALTEVAAGDVASPSTPLFARGYKGRGLTASNMPLSRPTEFDRTTLRGELAQGWEVELYRNNQLIDFQSSPVEGQYEFVDVPVLFGQNEFRLVFYGPYGQERVETKQVLVGSGMIKPGQSHYRLYAGQHNLDLIDFHEQSRLAQDGQPRMLGEYEYGLSHDISLTSAVGSLPLADGQHHYGSLGLKAVTGPVFSSLDIAHDVGQGWSGRLAAHTNLAGLNVVSEHVQFYQDFASEQFGGAAGRLSRSRVRLDGTLRVSDVVNLPLSLRVEHNRWQDDRNNTLVAQRTFSSFGQLYLSHNLDLLLRTDQSPAIYGKATARWRFDRLTPRLQASYAIRPDTELRAYSAAVDIRVNQDWAPQLGFLHWLGERDHVQLRGAVRRRFETFDTGVTVGFSNEAGWAAGLSLSTSFGRDPRTGDLHLQSQPMTSHGMVMAQVFEDLDQDGVRDADESPIANTGFHVGQNQSERATTDEQGKALLRGLSSYSEVDVGLLAHSFEDPFALAVRPGATIVPRPGKVNVIDFPVVIAGEVEGTLLQSSDGGTEPLGGVVFQLVKPEGEVVAETVTAFDGLYLFNYVPPGRYLLRIDPEQAADLGLEAPEPTWIEVEGNGSVLDRGEFVLDAPSDAPRLATH